METNQWAFFSTAQNTLIWSVVHQLDKTTSKAALEQRFRNNENSEWGAIPAQSMCEETKDFPIPSLTGEVDENGVVKMGRMGDIYALTPKEFVSKVMREEKVFETWYDGRVVLLGDGKCVSCCCCCCCCYVCVWLIWMGWMEQLWLILEAWN